MREDTELEKELKRQIQLLETNMAIQERNQIYAERVIHVLVAVGYLTNAQVEKAREIVRSFS